MNWCTVLRAFGVLICCEIALYFGISQLLCTWCALIIKIKTVLVVSSLPYFRFVQGEFTNLLLKAEIGNTTLRTSWMLDFDEDTGQRNGRRNKFTELAFLCFVISIYRYVRTSVTECVCNWHGCAWRISIDISVCVLILELHSKSNSTSARPTSAEALFWRWRSRRRGGRLWSRSQRKPRSLKTTKHLPHAEHQEIRNLQLNN